MLRPNAHQDYEVLGKHPPLSGGEAGLNFPLPYVGQGSPDTLTIQILAKITFIFGVYFLLLRFTGMSSAGVASLLANVVAVIYGVALAIKLFTPERGEAEWVIWLLAVVGLVAAIHWLFPTSFLTPNWNRPAHHSMIEPILQLVILVLLLLSAVAPSVKNVLLRKSRGELAVGLFASLFGGQLAAWSYLPASDFSAWSFLAAMAVVAWAVTAAVADQYARFEVATSPAMSAEESSYSHGPAMFLPLYQSFAGLGVLALSLWFGNLVFLRLFGQPNASSFGFLGVAAVLAGASVIRGLLQGQSPVSHFVEAWHAATFFLTYNLQQNDNPHAYQCQLWCRSPLLRLLIVGVGVTSVGLSLFHLSGVHMNAQEISKAKGHPVPAVWNKMLPQGHPSVLASFAQDAKGFEAFKQVAPELTEKGDVAPAKRGDSSSAELVSSAAWFLLGGPFGFLFLLATVQGNYLSWVRKKLSALEDASFSD